MLQCTCPAFDLATYNHEQGCDIWFDDDVYYGVAMWDPTTHTIVNSTPPDIDEFYYETTTAPDPEPDPVEVPGVDEAIHPWGSNRNVRCVCPDFDAVPTLRAHCDICGVVAYKSKKGQWRWKPTDDHRKWLRRVAPKRQCICLNSTKDTCATCNSQRSPKTGKWHYYEPQKAASAGGGGTGGTHPWAQKCRHYGEQVTLVDGTVVECSSLDNDQKTPPDIGFYLASGWAPGWRAYAMGWQDYGLPAGDHQLIEDYVNEVLERARAGQRVQIGCVGGHGRTGTFLALVATAAGTPPAEAAAWVRKNYCHEAIESAEQEWYILAHDAWRRGVEAPPPPPKPEPKAYSSHSSASSATGGLHSVAGHVAAWITKGVDTCTCSLFKADINSEIAKRSANLDNTSHHTMGYHAALHRRGQTCSCKWWGADTKSLPALANVPTVG